MTSSHHPELGCELRHPLHPPTTDSPIEIDGWIKALQVTKLLEYSSPRISAIWTGGEGNLNQLQDPGGKGQRVHSVYYVVSTGAKTAGLALADVYIPGGPGQRDGE